MKNIALLGLFSLLLLSLACGGDASHTPADPGEGHAEPASEAQGAHEAAGETLHAMAQLEPTSGSEAMGTAHFTAENGQVTLQLDVSHVSPGAHAFHLHAVGDCSAPDGTSAGGHWNPAGAEHGKWGSTAFHLGDVGNLEVGEDGTGSITVTTDLWSIGSGADHDILGRAVILHVGVDDFTTQPTGAAGGRIACGVIQ